MTRRETIRRITEAVAPLYPPGEASAIARAAVAGTEKTELSHLLAHMDEECRIGTAEMERITAQLAAGRPLQYVLGRCDFCGLEFEVGEGVLIPRPETEELVAAVLERADEGASVLDLCTGSGCIAVALAKRLKNSVVTAVDISAEALEYARRNAAGNDARVDFRQGDVFNLPAGELTAPFDVIVSNPPYVPQSDIDSMHINVKGFEPHTALFVPDGDPLIFYERIAGLGREILRHGGLLAFEIYELYAGRIAAMLREKGYCRTEIIEDANLKPRIVCCRK